MDGVMPSPEQIEQEQYRQRVAIRLATPFLAQYDRGLITLEELIDKLQYDVLDKSHREVFKREVNKRCERMVGIIPDLMGDWDEDDWYQSWRDTTLDENDWRDLLYHIFVECNDMDADDFGDFLAEMQRTS